MLALRSICRNNWRSLNLKGFLLLLYKVKEYCAKEPGGIAKIQETAYNRDHPLRYTILCTDLNGEKFEFFGF